MDSYDTLVFRRGQSRLFDPFWLAIHIADAMSVATAAMMGHFANGAEVPDQTMGIVAKTTNKCVFFPIFQPIRLALDNRRVDTVSFRITSVEQIEHYKSSAAYGTLFNRLMTLPFIAFFEQNLECIAASYGVHRRNWPMILQFAWVLRNGFVHHDGHVNFMDPAYPKVNWNNIELSPNDNGKLILGDKFSVGDVILLMI